MRDHAPAAVVLAAGVVAAALLALSPGAPERPAEAHARATPDAGPAAGPRAPRFPEGRYVRAALYANELLKPPYEATKPAFELKRAPQPRDWLHRFPERGQTYEEYVTSQPRRPSGGRDVVYLQLVGRFSAAQERVVRRTAAYLAVFFELRVEFLPPLPDRVVPAGARRRHGGIRQLRTDFLLFRVLEPSLPDDAMALVGFTATDLYPGDDWNFVFGQSSFDRRVAVFSLARLGDAGGSPADFRQCLERTMKIAAHELGHAFSMPHCVAYECLMNGNNGLFELDSQTAELCPVCLQKLCANVECEPVEHLRALEAFVRAEGFEGSAERYRTMARLAAAAR